MPLRSRTTCVWLLSALVGALAGACSLTTDLSGLANGAAAAGAPEGGAGESGVDAGARDATATSDGGGVDAATSAYAAAVLADAPLLYYRLGESDVKGTAHDSSSAARAATFKGNVVCGVPGAITGDVDTACRFDGTTAAVFLPGGPTFKGTVPYSFEAWARPTNVSGPDGHVVVGCESEPNDGYALFFYLTPSPQMERETSSGTSGIKAPDISGADYVHIVGTFDGTTQRLYVEGLLRVTNQTAVPLPAATVRPFSIGANNDADTNRFEGDIDEVAVYDHVLSPERVMAHHDVGRGLATR